MNLDELKSFGKDIDKYSLKVLDLGNKLVALIKKPKVEIKKEEVKQSVDHKKVENKNNDKNGND